MKKTDLRASETLASPGFTCDSLSRTYGINAKKLAVLVGAEAASLRASVRYMTRNVSAPHPSFYDWIRNHGASAAGGGLEQVLSALIVREAFPKRRRTD